MIDYSLKFTKLPKYAPTLVIDRRARMNKFVMGVYSYVEQECRTSMVRNDMDISRLMVYDQAIEESNLREIKKDLKRPRINKQSKLKSKKSFYIQDYSTRNKHRVSK